MLLTKTKYYWTFDEVLVANSLSNYTAYCTRYFADDDYVKELVKRFEIRSQAGYFMVNDSESTTSLSNTWFLNMFTELINETKDKYEAMLKAQDDLKDDIMDSAKSVQVTKYSDTPEEFGDYSADTYTSTISRTENSVDLDVITKLEQVESAMDDIYDKWLLVFRGFMIYE